MIPTPLAMWTTTLAGHNQSWLSFAFALSFAALAHGAWLRSAAWRVVQGRTGAGTIRRSNLSKVSS
jgi:hypothetical protein